MHALGGARILVVEDNLTIAISVCDILEDGGCTIVGPVGHFDQARQLAMREAIDAALLDVDLNGTRSYPIAAALRARGIPVAMLTGFDAESLPPELAGVPVREKPIDPEDLLRLVAEIIETKPATANTRRTPDANISPSTPRPGE